MRTPADDDDQDALAGRIREELARRRISRQRLADEAKISISTLEKALAGRRPFTLATVIRLEQALGAPLRSAAPQPASAPPAAASGFAPEALGSYSRPSVGWLEGDYLTLRPSFEDRAAVYAYRTVIEWDEGASSLVFHETDRVDAAFTQKGSVSVPNKSGHIYLITNDSGQFRVAMLGRPTISGEMYGLLSTLVAGQGAQLTPAAAPIVLVPVGSGPPPLLGRIGQGQPSYGTYRAHLQRALSQGFVRMFAD